MKMPIAVTGIIAHGHGNIWYAYYGLDIFSIDSNHTVGSIARLLRDLEGVSKNSSRILFSPKDGQSPLIQAVLEGSKMCLDPLLPLPHPPIPHSPLSPILTLQLDNAKSMVFCILFFSCVQRHFSRDIY